MVSSWRSRSLTSWLVVATGFGLTACKTPGTQSQINATEDSATSAASGGSDGAASLRAFDYELDPVLLAELGARIGCDQAAKWASYPAGGNLKAAIQKVAASPTVYDTVISNFFRESDSKGQCQKGSTATKNLQDGVKALVAKMATTYPGELLTIVVHGGYGTHLAFETALDESIGGWQQIADGESTPSIDFWQFKCSNSFAPQARCGTELLQSMKSREESDGPDKKRRYLMWGYSRGSNAILEALRESQDLRDKTAALVTIGSPIGGAVGMTMAGPVIQKMVASLSKLSGVAAETAQQFPEAFLMLADYFNDEETLTGKLLKLATPAELAAIKEGTAELQPAARQAYLRGDFRAANFARTDGSAIKVFHTASLLDVARLHPTPDFTVIDGKAALTGKHFFYGQLVSLGLSPVMMNYPLSDASVALQHAVIPKDATPAGLSPEFIGLFKFDHFANRLTPPSERTWEIPHLAMVDAILDTVAQKLAGGQP